MQKPTSQENTCTCTVQLPHEWQISLSWRFMYTDALSLMVQTKSLTHIEVLLTSLLFSLLFFLHETQLLNERLKCKESFFQFRKHNKSE